MNRLILGMKKPHASNLSFEPWGKKALRFGSAESAPGATTSLTKQSVASRAELLPPPDHLPDSVNERDEPTSRLVGPRKDRGIDQRSKHRHQLPGVHPELPFYWDDEASPRRQTTQKRSSTVMGRRRRNARVGIKKAG
jgi:hypothetical protein